MADEHPTPPHTPRGLATTKDLELWKVVYEWLDADPPARMVEFRCVNGKPFVVVRDNFRDAEIPIAGTQTLQAVIRGIELLSQSK